MTPKPGRRPLLIERRYMADLGASSEALAELLNRTGTTERRPPAGQCTENLAPPEPEDRKASA